MFVSKAETLRYLSGVLKKAHVLPVQTLTYQQWQASASSCISELLSGESIQFPFVVRSSSFSEDTLTESAAGKYLSLLDIQDEEALADAVKQVFASYGDELCADSQVLIQPQLTNIARCGVIFTRDPNNGGYYYVVNYDESGDTQSVTSGYGNSQVVEYWLHESSDELRGWRCEVFELLQELKSLYPNVVLDVEFAVNTTGQLYVFQVRPLLITAGMQEQRASLEEIRAQILQLSKKIQQLNKPHPHLLGEKAVFANMPDWNPAEMIGTRPKPLALSLYKNLITDNIWAYQRHRYGYRDLRSFPLLVCLGNSPFINVRVSFNSFIPKAISDSLAEKLVNHYLNQLQTQPHLQDKVEFDIVLSCYSFDMPKRCELLHQAGFTSTEIASLVDALKVLTSRVIEPKTGLLATDIDKLEVLQKRFDAVQCSELNDIEAIYWLIEDCKRYGTLPFAGIARAGFIAKQLLDSMVVESLLSEARAHDFLGSLHTVSGQFVDDAKAMNSEAFFGEYGHLRPGTYDIESLRYDEMPDLVRQRPAHLDTELSAWAGGNSASSSSGHFVLSSDETAAISQAIQQHKLPFSVKELFNFMRQAMEGREKAKFLFTRNVSEVLKRLTALGARKGFSRQSLAYVDIQDVLGLYSSTLSTTHTFNTSIQKNKSYYELCAAINLPPVILDESDVFCFQLPSSQPNFVTLKTAFGAVCDDLSECLDGKIVFIPAADPGFDWIFSHQICGLVTMYGGVNSHMAIRAGELSIPAVIGAGEALYERWKKGSMLKLDCQAKQVELLYESISNDQNVPVEEL